MAKFIECLVNETCQRSKNIVRGKVKRGRPIEEITGGLHFWCKATQEYGILWLELSTTGNIGSGWNMKLNKAKHAEICLYPILELGHQKTCVCERS